MQNNIDDSLHHLEDSLIVSQNVNIELPYDHQFHSYTTAYTTKFQHTQQKKIENIYTQQKLTHEYCCIHTSQKLETTQMPIKC